MEGYGVGGGGCAGPPLVASGDGRWCPRPPPPSFFQIAARYNLPKVPKLIDIIAAVPEEQRAQLLPRRGRSCGRGGARWGAVEGASGASPFSTPPQPLPLFNTHTPSPACGPSQCVRRPASRWSPSCPSPTAAPTLRRRATFASTALAALTRTLNTLPSRILGMSPPACGRSGRGTTPTCRRVRASTSCAASGTASTRSSSFSWAARSCPFLPTTGTTLCAPCMTLYPATPARAWPRRCATVSRRARSVSA